jgi:hypothetical protein
MSVSQPTLSSGATTITLPFPVRTNAVKLEYSTVGGSRLTVNGSIRTWSVGYRFSYSLAFEYENVTTYDALVALYWANVSNQTTTTFTWTGGPFTPAQPGVTVRIDSISDLVTVYPDVTKGDYQITLVEVDARTS